MHIEECAYIAQSLDLEGEKNNETTHKKPHQNPLYVLCFSQASSLFSRLLKSATIPCSSVIMHLPLLSQVDSNPLGICVGLYVLAKAFPDIRKSV